MKKSEILENNWLEFLEFWRQLMKEAKQQELDQGDDIFKLMANPDKLKGYAVFEEFKTPDETTFWKWYVMVKTKKED